MKLYTGILSAVIGMTAALTLQAKPKYENFKVSVYTRAYEVQKMADQHWLDSTWNAISSKVDVDKIYLETHRDKLIVDRTTMEKAIKFFKSKGLEVAGGITFTISEANSFETYCYQDPVERAEAQKIVEYTAGLFDEVILDDFFFIDCKCDWCIEAKGDRSWTDYRLELMHDAAENVVLGPAHKVNPKVKVVIKYPNWYDHFPALGFDLDHGPKHFDGIYTGTETRDAVSSDQHLQPYLGYLIWRYFDNLNPGHNGGGWVDTGGARILDRYSEQLWLTLFAKAPEMTLFDYRQMLMDREVPDKNGNKATFAECAGRTLKEIDSTIGKLGRPVGIKSYKPYQSEGEDFLQNYFGMAGLPMDLVPYFPEEENFMILTEQAAADPDIVSKIEKQLRNGKDVMITSGLLRALQDRGIRNIVDLEYTDRKAIASAIKSGRYGTADLEKPMLMQQIAYKTNDSWELISGMDGGLGWPVLHRGLYGHANLYLLVVPDNFSDLYRFPAPALNIIRSTASARTMPVYLEGPAYVSLFVYDNGTAIVESFLDEEVTVSIVSTKDRSRQTITLEPHSFKLIKTEQ
ncbi:MAG: hypothetical protein Q4G10_01570 [Bacteroidia bacterium]|nr:hypothetical protein [Bacteroidia bacterium]